MALLARTDGRFLDSHLLIRPVLDSIGVHLEEWPLPTDPEIRFLLDQERLTSAQAKEILEGFHQRFDDLRESQGFQSQDLVVLFPELPDLDTMLGRFVSCHTHDDNEIRYIIDGEGVFGFVLPNGDQVELTMSAGDYINVPAGAEHWFRLTPKKRIKAIRYFTSREGWVPNYTGRPVQSFEGGPRKSPVSSPRH
jgi:1,2-dihydroxy-3-keto-5-methylthiopentene dioxygenase